MMDIFQELGDDIIRECQAPISKRKVHADNAVVDLSLLEDDVVVDLTLDHTPPPPPSREFVELVDLSSSELEDPDFVVDLATTKSGGRRRAKRARKPKPKGNVMWVRDGHCARLQSVYDRVNPHRKIVKRLWARATAVKAGCLSSQSELDKGSDSLLCRGVIYALFCWKSRKLYIGLTMHCTFQRFKEHVRTARAGRGEPLYVAMRNMGGRTS
jgi:hypothetical protein